MSLLLSLSSSLYLYLLSYLGKDRLKKYCHKNKKSHFINKYYDLYFPFYHIYISTLFFVSLSCMYSVIFLFSFMFFPKLFLNLFNQFFSMSFSLSPLCVCRIGQMNLWRMCNNTASYQSKRSEFFFSSQSKFNREKK